MAKNVMDKRLDYMIAPSANILMSYEYAFVAVTHFTKDIDFHWHTCCIYFCFKPFNDFVNIFCMLRVSRFFRAIANIV